LKSFIVARGGDSSLPPWGGVNLQNNLPSELQRLVRLATGCPLLKLTSLRFFKLTSLEGCALLHVLKVR
jgi:hypothetical protein